jgi:serine/threonine protein kinase
MSEVDIKHAKTDSSVQSGSYDQSYGSPIDGVLGQVIGNKYRVEEFLAAGGWGRVYRASDLNLGRTVAAKLLHPGFVLDELKFKRFRAEAELLARLDHPHVCRVFDYECTADGQPVLIMEFLDGESLRSLLHSGKRLTVEETAFIGIQLCSALSQAANMSLVHRDIKPDNVHIQVIDGVINCKLVDFGLAKLFSNDDRGGRSLTETGNTVGSPSYMSPEQCQALPLDCRSDLYSLACVLYEAVSGQPAFEGTSLLEIMNAHLGKYPQPLPRALAGEKHNKHSLNALWTTLARALRKDPAHRYQKPAEMSADLQRVIKGQRVHALNFAASEYTKRMVTAGICIGLCGFAGIVWLHHRLNQDKAKAPPAHSKALALTRSEPGKQNIDAHAPSNSRLTPQQTQDEAQSARSPSPTNLKASPPSVNIGGSPPSVNIVASPVSANITGSPASTNIKGSSPSPNIKGSSPSANIKGSSPSANIKGSSPSANIKGSSPSPNIVESPATTAASPASTKAAVPVLEARQISTDQNHARLTSDESISVSQGHSPAKVIGPDGATLKPALAFTTKSAADANKPGIVKTDPATAVTSADSQKWSLFTDPSGKFAMRYPNSYEPVKQNKNAYLSAKMLKTDREFGDTTITVATIPVGMQLQEYNEDRYGKLFQTTQSHGRKFSILGRRDTNFCGLPAIEVTTEIESKQAFIVCSSLVCSKDHRIYKIEIETKTTRAPGISGEAVEQYNKRRRDELEPLFSSFQMLSTPESIKCDEVASKAIESFSSGKLLMEQGKLLKARDQFGLALSAWDSLKSMKEMNMPFRNRHASFSYQARALCYSKLHQLQLAVEDLTEAIKLRPDSDQLYLNRALAYDEMGKTDLAEADRHRADQLTDNKSGADGN